MRGVSLVVCAIGLAGLVGCASAPPKAPAFDLTKADALVAEGCYDCLTDALGIYTAAAASPKSRPAVLTRVFETTVLLGLREKELALNPIKRFDAARALIPELPPTYTATDYLEMAQAILPDGRHAAHRDHQYLSTGRNKACGMEDVAEAGAGGALFRDYLSVSLDCSFAAPNMGPARAAAPGQPPARQAETPATQSTSTLVTYRRANCQRMDRVMLAGVVDAYPRFLEAGIIVGRVRSTTPTSREIADARGWLTAGFAKWPDSPTITYALGTLNQAVGDCKTALTFYDKTLAIKPRHEDGHLGRLVCLSYLRQHAAAIDQATSMINDRNTEGEARYWRAWNRREINQLPEARSDSDRMKQILTIARSRWPDIDTIRMTSAWPRRTSPTPRDSTRTTASRSGSGRWCSSATGVDAHCGRFRQSDALL
jgi:hypothetical protein